MFNFNFENKQQFDTYQSANALQEALLAQGILPMPNQLISQQIQAESPNLQFASQTQSAVQQTTGQTHFNTTTVADSQRNVVSLASVPEVQAQFGMAKNNHFGGNLTQDCIPIGSASQTILNSNFKSSFNRPKIVNFEEVQCSTATAARKDKHCLKKFYSMNKIVPGGLLRLKKQSKAIRKQLRASKSKASSPKDKQSKSLIVSIPIVKELNLQLKPQSSTIQFNSDATTWTPNNREATHNSCSAIADLNRKDQDLVQGVGKFQNARYTDDDLQPCSTVSSSSMVQIDKKEIADMDLQERIENMQRQLIMQVQNTLLAHQ